MRKYFSHLQSFILLFFLLSCQGVLAQYGDCRLNLKSVKPIIKSDNPFFADHQWNLITRMEMAQLDLARFVMITQDGCKRHHTHFKLIMDPRTVVQSDSFWIDQVKSFMYQVYYGRESYLSYQEPFEREFTRQFQSYGLNQQFNFPIGTRNFICEIRFSKENGAVISIEQVDFIFREEVVTQRKSASREVDDGWFGVKDPENDKR